MKICIRLYRCLMKRNQKTLAFWCTTMNFWVATVKFRPEKWSSTWEMVVGVPFTVESSKNGPTFQENPAEIWSAIPANQLIWWIFHYFQGFSPIPAGDRRISEPSTVVRRVFRSHTARKTVMITWSLEKQPIRDISASGELWTYKVWYFALFRWWQLNTCLLEFSSRTVGFHDTIRLDYYCYRWVVLKPPTASQERNARNW